MVDIKLEKCEICGEPAKVGMNDNNNKLHFACLETDHVQELWDKIRKE